MFYCYRVSYAETHKRLFAQFPLEFCWITLVSFDCVGGGLFDDPVSNVETWPTFCQTLNLNSNGRCHSRELIKLWTWHCFDFPCSLAQRHLELWAQCVLSPAAQYWPLPISLCSQAHLWPLSTMSSPCLCLHSYSHLNQTLDRFKLTLISIKFVEKVYCQCFEGSKAGFDWSRFHRKCHWLTDLWVFDQGLDVDLHNCMFCQCSDILQNFVNFCC